MEYELIQPNFRFSIKFHSFPNLLSSPPPTSLFLVYLPRLSTSLFLVNPLFILISTSYTSSLVHLTPLSSFPLPTPHSIVYFTPLSSSPSPISLFQVFPHFPLNLVACHLIFLLYYLLLPSFFVCVQLSWSYPNTSILSAAPYYNLYWQFSLALVMQLLCLVTNACDN